jgi:hypothetical protein
MIYLALGAGVLALLVWAGRGNLPSRIGLRAAGALFAALAAAGAVVAGLRGAWLLSLGLIVIAAWLGQGARRRAEPASNHSAGGMSLDQARAILGVTPGATRAEIEAAYRHLIRRAHPDQGGTSGLAAQLNAARDRLVK